MKLSDYELAKKIEVRICRFTSEVTRIKEYIHERNEDNSKSDGSIIRNIKNEAEDLMLVKFKKELDIAKIQFSLLVS